MTSATLSKNKTKQKREPSNGLPSPYDHPERLIVVYDGHCRFCLKQVRRLHGWDGKARLAFVSLHDPFVKEYYPDLSHDQLMAEMWVVDERGNRYGGAAAFRFLTRRLPKLWVLAPLLHIPFTLPIWQWAYKQVAKRRYKISKKYGDDCDSGSCDIHFD